MISPFLLSELKNIFHEDYGVDLPPKELSEVGHSLVGIFELLAKMSVSGEDTVCHINTLGSNTRPPAMQGGVQL